MQQYLEQIQSIAIPSKYTKWYCNIILGSTQQGKQRERHHILPKCFGLGGEHDKNNIVRLSYREHFMCHRLLCKMVTGKFKQKMTAALWRMCNSKQNHNVNSRNYERARSEYVLSRIGHITSDETKQKISAKLKGKPKTVVPWNKGLTGYSIHTEESKRRIGVASQNRSLNVLEKIRVASKRKAELTLKGRTHKEIYGSRSDQLRKQVSEKLKGKCFRKLKIQYDDVLPQLVLLVHDDTCHLQRWLSPLPSENFLCLQ